MNTNELKAKIVAKGMTIKSFCEKAGLVRATFDRKLRGESEFNRDEIEKIQDTLKLTSDELMDIFFAKEVA